MLGIRARAFLPRAIKTPAFTRFVGAIATPPGLQDLNQGDLKRRRSPAGGFKTAADLPCHHDPGKLAKVFSKQAAVRSSSREARYQAGKVVCSVALCFLLLVTHTIRIPPQVLVPKSKPVSGAVNPSLYSAPV